MKKIKYLLVAILIATSSLLVTSRVHAMNYDNITIINPHNWNVENVQNTYKITVDFNPSNESAKGFEIIANEHYILSDFKIKIMMFGVDASPSGVFSGKRFYNYENAGYKLDDEMLITHAAPSVTHEVTITFKVIEDPNNPAPVDPTPVPTERPAISGKDSIINNVDAPYTESEIRAIAKIKVTDAYDGDITNLLVVDEDNYTSNNSVVGNFTITYSATNTSNLTSTYTLNVINRDFVAPEIKGEDTSTISYKAVVTDFDIVSKYTATDNYDGKIDLAIVSSNYEKNKVGKFTFKLQAKDSSGNTTVATHTLNVIDDIAPVITDNQEGTIQISFLKKLSNSELLFGLSAIDEIDGDLTSKIKIVDNQLTNKKGVYSVVFEVADTSGNEATYERRYEVISTEVPVFYVSKNLISIEDVNKMNNDQLALIISNYNNIQMASYEIITNEYETNEATTGEYLLSMKIVDVNDQEHIFDNYKINVFNKSNLPKENEEPKAKTIWQKIADFFVNLWNGIKAFFKWLRKILAAPFKWVISLFK